MIWSFRARLPSAFLVNLPAVTDIVQINAAHSDIEFVENTIISHSQFELGAPPQALMRESVQSRSHLVDLFPDGAPHRRREAVKRAGERRRPNLERGRHAQD